MREDIINLGKKYRNMAVFMLGDIFFINIIYLLVLYLRFDGVVPPEYLDVYHTNFWILTGIKVLILMSFRVYNNIWLYASIGELLQLGVAIFIANVVASGYIMAYVTYINDWFPRSVFVLVLVFDGILLGGIRFARRLMTYLVNRSMYSGRRRKRVMIVGAGKAGSSIIREISSNKNKYLLPVIAVDDDVNKKYKRIHGVKIAGGSDEILDLVNNYKIQEIIIAMPSTVPDEQHRIIEECRKTKCSLKILSDVYESMDDSLMNKVRDVSIEDLLGREEIQLDTKPVSEYIKDKTVLVTGGGGSIGSELCRQIAKFLPERLIILDIYENNAYDLQNELLRKYKELDLAVYIASVRDSVRIEEIIDREKPSVIFHAAAHKHVPLMEFNPKEAIKNNVFGTYNVATAAMNGGVDKFVLISTDKAVNPTNIMGATKRICEMIVQSLSKESTTTEFVAVRFGNVLGSNGSVIPLFKRQITEGGPVTVTHPDIIRYFMTIPEAAQLVLQAGSMAEGGEVFVLDMGQPVKIVDLAKELIRLSGLRVGEDIDIEFTGLRPGEKLYEELLLDGEVKKTRHHKIFIGQPSIGNFILYEQITNLKKCMFKVQDNEVFTLIKTIVPTYVPNKTEKEMLDEIAITREKQKSSI